MAVAGVRWDYDGYEVKLDIGIDASDLARELKVDPDELEAVLDRDADWDALRENIAGLIAPYLGSRAGGPSHEECAVYRKVEKHYAMQSIAAEAEYMGRELTPEELDAAAEELLNIDAADERWGEMCREAIDAVKPAPVFPDPLCCHAADKDLGLSCGRVFAYDIADKQDVFFIAEYQLIAGCNLYIAAWEREPGVFEYAERAGSFGEAYIEAYRMFADETDGIGNPGTGEITREPRDLFRNPQGVEPPEEGQIEMRRAGVSPGQVVGDAVPQREANRDR